jgi:hypothetical protein
MQGSPVRAVILLAVCAVVVAMLGARVHAARSATATPEITDAERAATFNLDAVSRADGVWILAAVASARPEAQRLIAEVDGLVEVRTDLNSPTTIYLGGDTSQAIGLTTASGGRATIALDIRHLNGERAIDRNMVVLHELGHVLDYLLVDDDVMRQLDAGIPAGECRTDLPAEAACTAIEERFADTFAKWALRGRFSLAGSGYGIPTPPSLEDWGRPLGRLALELDR